jgi:hypothetical protein
MASFSTPPRSSKGSAAQAGTTTPDSVSGLPPSPSSAQQDEEQRQQQFKSVKWLSVSKSGLTIEAEAMGAVQQEHGHVNTVMVFGKIGTGEKSTLQPLTVE